MFFKILRKVQNNVKIVVRLNDPPPTTILSGGLSPPTTLEKVGKYVCP